jgi:HEAT repeat protein
MVALLGEIGDPATIDMLQQTYLHENLRVRREVLKSMARIASDRSTQFLIKALDEPDKALVNQAITSLGMLRDPAAIERLGEIALSWDSFAESQEAKREAIKALGIIGDQRAVGCLTKILLKKRWFSKVTNEDFRALSANALGMIGGEDAFKAIEKVLGGSEGDLFNTCKRILDGREKKA